MAAMAEMIAGAERSEVVYKLVPGFPSYRVGDDGSIWSSRRPGFRPRAGSAVAAITRWRQLIPASDGRYLRTTLFTDTTKRSRCVHQLVALAFLGPCPPGMQVAHENGKSTDNRVANLSYKTPKANQFDRVRHGTTCHGERNGVAKLTATDVCQIRRRCDAGRS